MPPLNPPREPVSTNRVSVSSPRPWLAAVRASRSTPRSEGTESNPHAWTILAPEAWAASWLASMLARMNSTSPVRST